MSKRAVLSGGGSSIGGADLTGTPHIHVEAKRTEKFSPYEAIRQAEATIEKSEADAWPVVVNRKNLMPIGESLVVMRLDHWLKLYQGVLPQEKLNEDDASKLSFMSLL